MNKIAMVFPGQGSQYVGMGKDLYQDFKVVREVFEEANDVLGFDLKKLCFEGDLEELTKTENTQPAILTLSVGTFKAYMQEIGIEPAFCAGHSLGEYSALTCSGAFCFADSVRIVNKRGKFMQNAVEPGLGAMAAVSGIEVGIIDEECKYQSNQRNIVVISNYNSPDQFVISGQKNAVIESSERLKVKKARIIPLKVSAPFHSPMMQPAADKLREELGKYKYSALKYPVISNVTGLPYQSEHCITDNLCMQLVEPVRWTNTADYLARQGIDMVVEIGPKTVLRDLIRKSYLNIKAFSYDEKSDVKEIREKLIGTKEHIDDAKSKKLLFIIRCLAVAVCTKNRNWDNDAYRTGVIDPYRKVQAMLDELEQKGDEPTMDQLKEASKMLKSVFETKGCPEDEQEKRFNQIFNETGLRNLFE